MKDRRCAIVKEHEGAHSNEHSVKIQLVPHQAGKMGGGVTARCQKESGSNKELRNSSKFFKGGVEMTVSMREVVAEVAPLMLAATQRGAASGLAAFHSCATISHYRGLGYSYPDLGAAVFVCLHLI